MIQFPNGFATRDYQDGFFQHMGRGGKRAILIWHRRAGKDLAAWNWCIFEAMRKTGTYYYFFPTYAQGKKIMWDGFDSQGKKLLHYIPVFEECKFNETEMQITLPPIQGGSQGSVIQIIGTDKMDYIVGTNPIGCVFSEYAIQNPRAWSLTRPILAANGGWAVFVTTPRGRNHAHKLFHNTIGVEGWYNSLLTIRDTVREDGRAVIEQSMIDEFRQEGEDEAIIQQEYFCSFEGGLVGAYYGEQIRIAERDNRICRLPVDVTIPVYTYWDIGRDTTSIGLVQYVDKMVHWVGYIANKNEGLPYYVSALDQWRKDYKIRWGGHYFPHDMEVKEWGANEQRIIAARRMGLSPCHTVPKLDVDQGIDAVRRKFSTYVFDADRCDDLLNALRSYTKEYDEVNMVWKAKPLHNWASHPADMVRYQATSRMPSHELEGKDLPRVLAPIDDPLAAYVIRETSVL